MLTPSEDAVVPQPSPVQNESVAERPRANSLNSALETVREVAARHGQENDAARKEIDVTRTVLDLKSELLRAEDSEVSRLQTENGEDAVSITESQLEQKLVEHEVYWQNELKKALEFSNELELKNKKLKQQVQEAVPTNMKQAELEAKIYTLDQKLKAKDTVTQHVESNAVVDAHAQLANVQSQLDERDRAMFELSAELERVQQDFIQLREKLAEHDTAILADEAVAGNHVESQQLKDDLRQGCASQEDATHQQLPDAKALVLHLQQEEKEYSAPTASEGQFPADLQKLVQAVEQSTIELARVFENSLNEGAPGESISVAAEEDPVFVLAQKAVFEAQEIEKFSPKARKQHIERRSKSNPNSPKIQQNISAGQLKMQAQNKR